jgi:hypothetical protein
MTQSKLNFFQTIAEKIQKAFEEESTYELFVFKDGLTELWKVDPTGKYYPQSRFMNRWVSDYGLGDYQSNKKLAVKINLILPENLESVLATYVHWETAKEDDRKFELAKRIAKVQAENIMDME